MTAAVPEHALDPDRQAQIRALTPGFPDGPATGAQVAAALKALLPKETARYRLSPSGTSVRLPRRFTGWAAVLGSREGLERSTGTGRGQWRHEGVVVGTKGHVVLVQAETDRADWQVPADAQELDAFALDPDAQIGPQTLAQLRAAVAMRREGQARAAD